MPRIDQSLLICGNLCLRFQIRHRCTIWGFKAYQTALRDARGLSESSSSILGPYLMSLDTSVLICSNLFLWFQNRIVVNRNGRQLDWLVYFGRNILAETRAALGFSVSVDHA